MDLLIFLIVVVVIALGTWLLVVGRPRGRTSVRDKVVPRLRAGRGQDAPTRLSFEVRVEPAAPFRRQAASGQSADIWVLPGRSITVAGYRLPDGMIYVATGLEAVTGDREEPAAIDPTMAVAMLAQEAPAPAMSYWPSYSSIPPLARSGYLRWLATGRSDPDIDVGYVFLFFYGLERRLLVDALRDSEARADVPRLIEELHRLLGIYGERNRSFQGYAHSLLDACALVHTQRRMYEQSPGDQIQDLTNSSILAVALGQLAADDQPVPAAWALAWVRATTPLRTPAQRCSHEFDRLFTLRFEQRYGLGLQLKTTGRRLAVPYQAASLSLMRPFALPIGDIPDVVTDSAELGGIRDMAVECCAELDPFSRWAGKAAGQTPTLEALALLPVELLSGQSYSSLGDFRTLLERNLRSDEVVTLEGSDIISGWPCDVSGKLKRAEAVLVAQLLDKLGCGIEPDVRFGGPVIAADVSAVLFRQVPGAPSAPSARYTAAASLMTLAGAVLVADDQVTPEEQTRIEAHVEASLELTEAERVRLRAHLRWLLSARPALTRVKARIEGLPGDQRARIGQFLASLVTADGQVHPAEILTLMKVYRLLGLDGDQIYGDLHAV